MYVLEVDSALIDLIKIRSSMLLDMFVNFLCFADQINIIITFNYTFTYSLLFDCFILTLWSKKLSFVSKSTNIMKQEVKYCIKIYQDIRIELYIYFTKKASVFSVVFFGSIKF